MMLRCPRPFIPFSAVAGLAFIAFPAGAQDTPVRYLGRASCAAATCHGGSIDRGPVWNHSLTLWTARDPHAGAGRLLRDEDSRQIVTALDPTAGQSPERYDNVLRTRCISCHATVEPAACEPRGVIDDRILAEGVSCESCHGPAEPWIDAHRSLDWPTSAGADPLAAARRGMRDTASVTGRAETCVRCHIGSRTADGLVRDMNHDLIAAGHPALRFDLLLYAASVPPHWDENSESAEAWAASSVRLRKASRAINLAAATSLASERAVDHLRSSDVPWPELADYDCFACHQSLSEKEYLLPPSQVKRSPLHISEGLPMWNSWHAIAQLPREKQLLRALAPHRSQPAEVARVLPRVAQTQRENAAEVSLASFDPQAVLDEALRDLKRDGVLDWHEAAVVYLDLDAALRDLAKQPETADRAARQRRQLIAQVEPLLRFTPPTPANAGAAETTRMFHSPVMFDPDAFRDAVFAALQSAPDAAEQARVNEP